MSERHTSEAMKKRSDELAALEAVSDDDIDYSDIPPVEDFSGWVRGMFYKPRKQAISLRIDSPVLVWFKSRGPGYQTEINRVLKQHMIDTMTAEKKAG